MNLDNEFISEHSVNGQTVYTLNTQAFEFLIKEPVIEGQAISAKDVIYDMMNFIRQHGSFYLAFYTLGIKGKWNFCLLFEMNSKLQRVQIESVKCKECNWEGIIANPTIPELYYGCPDRWGALDEAYQIPIVHCPQCDSKLPRHAIWVSV